MKIKKLPLGLIAFVFAVGSAFASLTKKPTIWVKAKLVEAGSDVCIDTGVTCSNSGTVPCTVTLPVQMGNNTTSATYKNSYCTLRIFGNTTGTANSLVQVFQLSDAD
jgi:hypothetical protein